MKNKKNISFFILFMLYIIIFIVTHDFLGEDVFYASVPMILGASILYGYAAGFLVIALNIPATLVLFYVFGMPFADSIKFINPFIILLSCICVVIPGMIKLYIDKSESQKFRGYEKKIDELTEKNEELNRISEETGLSALLYKGMFENVEKKDAMTGLLSRKAISEYIINEGAKKYYMIIKLRGIDMINKELGFAKGDEYITGIAEKLLDMNLTAGRITGACFIAFTDKEHSQEIIDKLKGDHHVELELYANKVEGNETLEAIFDKAAMS